MEQYRVVAASASFYGRRDRAVPNASTGFPQMQACGSMPYIKVFESLLLLLLLLMFLLFIILFLNITVV